MTVKEFRKIESDYSNQFYGGMTAEKALDYLKEVQFAEDIDDEKGFRIYNLKDGFIYFKFDYDKFNPKQRFKEYKVYSY